MARRHKGKKEDSQRAHFIRRVKERFGLHLKDHDISAIIKMIANSSTEFVEKQSNRVAVHKVTYQGETMHVCYDKQRGELVTALFPEGNPFDILKS